MRVAFLALSLATSACDMADEVRGALDGRDAIWGAAQYATGVEGATNVWCDGKYIDIVDDWVDCAVYRADAEPLAIQCRTDGGACR